MTTTPNHKPSFPMLHAKFSAFMISLNCFQLSFCNSVTKHIFFSPFAVTEMCLLSDDIHDYHFVSQGKIDIPGVDDAEEMQLADVSNPQPLFGK